MPKILLISADFSYQHSVGGERIRKFWKYLPDFGFYPYILTPARQKHKKSLNERQIYHSFELGHFYRPFINYLSRRRDVLSSPPSGAESNRVAGGVLKVTSWGRIRRWMLDNVAIPDVRIGWLPGAVVTGLRVIRDEEIDVILSSSYPNSAHLIAGILAKVTQLPWIADFRDGWLYESLYPVLRNDNRRRRLEQRMERWVVTQSDAIISVSNPLTEYFRTTYPSLAPKMLTITNGYDPLDWETIEPLQRDTGRFWLVHTGRFSLSRSTLSLRPILQALQLLDPTIRTKTRLILVGALGETERAMVRKHGLTDIVKEIGQVSRSESLAYQLSADCLLLMVGTDRSVATSKLYEYLFSGRPILAISASETAAASIVRETGAGAIVDPDDPQKIAVSLASMYQIWAHDGLLFHPTRIERYERRELARQLAEVLENVLACHVER